MYCKNCGKETENEAELCPECAKAAEETVETPAPEVEKETSEVVFDEIKSTLNPTSAVDNVKQAISDNVEEAEDSPKYCFKKSLTGTILAAIAFLISTIVAAIVSANSAELALGDYYVSNGEATGIIVASIICMVFGLVAFALSIPALVSGIKCVIRTAKRLNKPVKPIAPFVLSCVATVFGAESLFAGLISAINAIINLVTAISFLA